MSSRLSAKPTPESTARHGRFLTLDAVYIASVVVVTGAAALQVVVRPHDFWWHLANGRMMVDTATFPTLDSFTYTQAGEPFFNQMWLAQIVMFSLYRLGGVPLIILAHALVIALTYGLLLRLCVRVTGRVRVSAFVMLAVVLPLSFPNWSVRPQPYAFPLFVIFIWLLLNNSHPPRWSQSKSARLWLLPVLMVLWVNIHGSFVLGLGVVTLVAVTELVASKFGDGVTKQQIGRLAVLVCATWAATLVNPRGMHVIDYAANLMTNESVRLVSEWQPVTPTGVIGILYFLFSAAIILVLIYGPARPAVRQSVVVIALMLMGFSAQRHTIWFALAAAPLISLQVSSLIRAPRRRDDVGAPALNGALLMTLGLVLVLSLPWVRQTLNISLGGGSLIADTPVAAVRELGRLPQRPAGIFNEVGYGSYLAWALPEQKTFIDPRFELFPPEQIEDYQVLSQGRDVAALTRKYGFDGFLVSHHYQPKLVEQLRSLPDWEVAYEDDEASLFLPR